MADPSIALAGTCPLFLTAAMSRGKSDTMQIGKIQLRATSHLGATRCNLAKYSLWTRPRYTFSNITASIHVHACEVGVTLLTIFDKAVQPSFHSCPSCTTVILVLIFITLVFNQLFFSPLSCHPALHTSGSPEKGQSLSTMSSFTHLPRGKDQQTFGNVEDDERR